MRERFDAHTGLIIVPVELAGPGGLAQLRLALDTGATSTLIRPVHLEALGYDPAQATERVQMTTGSGIEFVLRRTVSRLSALGQSRTNFPILGHELPVTAAVDGLLGLDFLRHSRLEIDFKDGYVRLEI